MAIKILDSEQCPKCGVPSWWAYSEAPEIDFKMDKHTCYGCQHKDSEEAKIKDMPKGQTNFVRAVPIEGYELPSRKDFYERMSAKAANKTE